MKITNSLNVCYFHFGYFFIMQPTAMDEKYVKYIWIILQTAIQEIQNNNSELPHDQIYHKAYEVVMNKHGFRMYNGLRELLTDHLQQKVRQELLESLESNFLSKLNKAWIAHQTSMLMLSDMLGYMDRTYAEQRGLDSVYNLGLKLFRCEIVDFSDIQRTLRQKLLDMIGEERLGAKINRLEIKNACTMLITLGIDSRYIYEKIFESYFLAQSKEFYEIESQKLVKENSAGYVDQMKVFMANEMERALFYLDKETAPRIEEVLEALIEKYKPV